jgi:hypothetical protein
MALGCNLILGTQPPLPGGPGGGVGSGGGNAAVPCGTDEWTHWSPTGTHKFDVTNGPDGNAYAVDQLTGLAWQSPPPAAELTVSWSAADTYCKALMWGGITGYRLPTAMELASLTRYDLPIPAMDKTLSPPNPGGAFWTGSTSNAAPNSAWIIAYGDGSISWADKSGGLAAARCVHDRKPSPDVTCERYTLVDGGSAVADQETGLVWQRAESSGMVNWSGATSACAALAADAGATWRLPAVAELLTLLDVGANSPSGLDPQFFAGEPGDAYWTRTVDATDATKAWSVIPMTGETQPSSQMEGAYARCVR